MENVTGSDFDSCAKCVWRSKSCWPAKSRVLPRELSGRLELKVDGLEQTLTLLSVTLTCTPARKVSSFQRRQISFEVSTLF